MNEFSIWILVMIGGLVWILLSGAASRRARSQTYVTKEWFAICRRRPRVISCSAVNAALGALRSPASATGWCRADA